MRKVLILTIVLLVLTASGYSQSIIVSKPAAGEIVIKGQSYTVRWTSEGRMAENVKLRLFNRAGTAKILDIANRVENSGRYSCPARLFTSVPSGEYVIRVKTVDNAVSDDSAVFSLVSEGQEPDPEPDPGQGDELRGSIAEFTVVYPNGGGRPLALNSQTKILWKAKKVLTSQVISLWKNGVNMGTIASGLAPGRISQIWTIGRTELKTVIPGDGFKIRVSEQGFINRNYDESDSPFTIEEERVIYLSCYIDRTSISSYLKSVSVVVKVRCRNFPGSIFNVPVEIVLKKKSDGTICGSRTRTISEIKYRGSSYEYTVQGSVHFGTCWDGYWNGAEYEVVATIDPDDLFRNKNRVYNTSKRTIKKD